LRQVFRERGLAPEVVQSALLARAGAAPLRALATPGSRPTVLYVPARIQAPWPPPQRGAPPLRWAAHPNRR